MQVVPQEPVGPFGDPDTGVAVEIDQRSLRHYPLCQLPGMPRWVRIVVPPSKSTKRCLPWLRTAVTVRPVSRPAATRTPGLVPSTRTTVRSASTRRNEAAAR